MTTFVFEVKNIPAALYKAMGGFATNGINMTKLESYQKNGSFAATEFYADIEGSPGDAAVDRALEELRFHCNMVRLLGTYRQARRRG
jgi:prephenate dehydratase